VLTPPREPDPPAKRVPTPPAKRVLTPPDRAAEWFTVVTEGLFNSLICNQTQGGEQEEQGSIRVPVYEFGSGLKKRFALTFGFSDGRRDQSAATLLIANVASGLHTWCVNNCRQRHLPDSRPCDGRESHVLQQTFKQLADGEETALFLMGADCGLAAHDRGMTSEKLYLLKLYDALRKAGRARLWLGFQRLPWHHGTQPPVTWVSGDSFDAICARLRSPTQPLLELCRLLFRWLGKQRLVPGQVLPDGTLRLPTIDAPIGLCVGFEDPARRDSLAVVMAAVDTPAYRWCVFKCRQTHGPNGSCDGTQTHVLDLSLEQLAESDDPLSALVLVDADLTTAPDAEISRGRISLLEVHDRIKSNPNTKFWLHILVPQWPCQPVPLAPIAVNLPFYQRVRTL
jgi:hypothetical protein